MAKELGVVPQGGDGVTVKVAHDLVAAAGLGVNSGKGPSDRSRKPVAPACNHDPDPG